MSNNTQIRLKFSYDDTVYARTVCVDAITFDYLYSTIATIFDPRSNFTNTSIKYHDDFRDYISIDTPDDVKEMISFVCTQNTTTLTLLIGPKKKRRDLTSLSTCQSD